MRSETEGTCANSEVVKITKPMMRELEWKVLTVIFHTRKTRLDESGHRSFSSSTSSFVVYVHFVYCRRATSRAHPRELQKAAMTIRFGSKQVAELQTTKVNDAPSKDRIPMTGTKSTHDFVKTVQDRSRPSTECTSVPQEWS